MSRQSRTRIALATACVAVISCSDGALVEPEIAAPDRVLFTRNGALLAIDADGSNEQQIVPGFVRTPQLMPHGRSVMVALNDDGRRSRLVEVPLDGSAPRTLPTGELSVDAFRFSPAAQHVAFIGQELGNSARFAVTHIMVMKADGTGLTNISSFLPPPGGSCNAQEQPRIMHHVMGWVSNGRLQLHRDVCGFGAAIYTVNIDGSDVREGYAGMISPDGTRLVRGVGAELVLTDVLSGAHTNIGSNAIVVDISAPQHFFASPWSADGTHIAYEDAVSRALYIARADGSGAKIVPRFPPEASAGAVFWGFAGSNDRVLFTKWIASKQSHELYLLKNDGSEPLLLSEGYFGGVFWLPGR